MQNDIKNLLEPIGITKLTEIQSKALEHYNECDELVLYAPTGSGKTLAFILPLIKLLRENPAIEGIQALILSPTRELALQIESVFKSLRTEFSITTCYGGHSLKTEVNNLSANPTIVVGTPGRISDHLYRENLNLKYTTIFIVDEFDKCLELGFHTEIEHIYGSIDRIKNSIFGSATKIDEFPVFIRLRNPLNLNQINEEDQPDFTFHSFQMIGQSLDTIKHLITQFQNESTIIFCNFREDVDGIADYFYENDMSITAYHGGLDQDVRERALIKFRNKSCPVLVCTDLGARGLDIPEVKHIIHFMIPDKEDAFIHRNGRTARMMANGHVYFFEIDRKTAKFDLPKTKIFEIDTTIEYQKPQFLTLYFSGGKKNKINKIDLLGFICQKGELSKEDIGVISVLDFTSYVSVKTKNVKELLSKLRSFKVKGQKLKIEISY